MEHEEPGEKAKDLVQPADAAADAVPPPLQVRTTTYIRAKLGDEDDCYTEYDEKSDDEYEEDEEHYSRRKGHSPLTRALMAVEGGGNFHASGFCECPIGRLDVEGLGALLLPIFPSQVQGLIKLAQQAPFGRGEQTVVDTSVRKVWQIDASKVTFTDPSWESFLASLVLHVKRNLGIAEGEVAPSFYKLLIYDVGSFFLPHQDSIKAPGMFGTLSITLPSKHTGGDLVIKHNGQEVTFETSSAHFDEISFAAFYADCEHEIKPLSSGYRVTLIYNLTKSLPTTGISRAMPSALDEKVEIVAKELKRIGKFRWCVVWIYEHQYPGDSFSPAELKNADREVTQVLAAAAAKVGQRHVCLGILESYSTGTNYGNEYFEYMRDIWFSRCFDVNGKHLMPGARISSPMVIPMGAFKRWEAAKEISGGPSGNEGVSFKKWHRYAAVMVSNSTPSISEYVNPNDLLDFVEKEKPALEVGTLKIIVSSLEKNFSRDACLRAIPHFRTSPHGEAHVLLLTKILIPHFEGFEEFIGTILSQLVDNVPEHPSFAQLATKVQESLGTEQGFKKFCEILPPACASKSGIYTQYLIEEFHKNYDNGFERSISIVRCLLESGHTKSAFQGGLTNALEVIISHARLLHTISLLQPHAIESECLDKWEAAAVAAIGLAETSEPPPDRELIIGYFGSWCACKMCKEFQAFCDDPQAITLRLETTKESRFHFQQKSGLDSGFIESVVVEDGKELLVLTKKWMGFPDGSIWVGAHLLLVALPNPPTQQSREIHDKLKGCHPSLSDVELTYLQNGK